MDILGAIGSVLTGGLGGIVGAAGAVAGKVIELKVEGEKRETLKVQNAHELALREADRVLAAQEAASQLTIHQTDASSAAVTADLGALQAAIVAEGKGASFGDSWSGRVVDFARGTVRPVLTAWAAVLLSYTTLQAFAQLRGVPLGPERSMALIQDATFMASLAISFWFGSRPNRSR